MKNVIVLGAGASGLIAALTAAENKDCRVTVLERQSRAGRKLLSTGNGRCNLTNTGATLANYHGDDPGFAAPALEAFPPASALDFFHSLGLLTVTEKGGRVYPLSDSANSVLDVLRYALEASGAELRTGEPAQSIRRTSDGFAVTTELGEHYADAVIVACGGVAGGKLGGVRDGYELLCLLGHSTTPLLPSLVQLRCQSRYPASLKGVRCDALLTLTSPSRTGVCRGELQFTDTGVSGPAAFELSRQAAFFAGAPQTLRLDFFADYPTEELHALLCRRCEALPELSASELLTGMLHNRLGRMLMKYAGIDPALPLRSLAENDLKTVVTACKRFSLPVTGTEGFAGAQVTAGGIRTSEFYPNTLQSRIVPGLYACGEVLDIDGDCGGYNLQWAWASGRLAGRLL